MIVAKSEVVAVPRLLQIRQPLYDRIGPRDQTQQVGSKTVGCWLVSYVNEYMRHCCRRPSSPRECFHIRTTEHPDARKKHGTEPRSDASIAKSPAGSIISKGCEDVFSSLHCSQSRHRIASSRRRCGLYIEKSLASSRRKNVVLD
jgi:hypothetical protein